MHTTSLQSARPYCSNPPGHKGNSFLEQAVRMNTSKAQCRRKAVMISRSPRTNNATPEARTMPLTSCSSGVLKTATQNMYAPPTTR